MTTKSTTTDMSEVTVVEFEQSSYNSETYLSSALEDGPPYTIHGVALGAGDITKGKSGIKKKWPAEELRQAADTLQGTNLVEDHDNDASGVIGKVTKAGYKEGTGIVYEAELYDEELAEKVKNGLLEVSVRGLHADVDSLEEDSDSGALVVEDIEFKNLSIVSTGASPSNTLQMGEHAELSAAELAEFTEDIEPAELEEIEAGMWVKWGDNRGVTISPVEDGEVEVDIYEEVDGEWRAIGETETVSVDDLNVWDVNEDNIGSAKDKDEGKDEEENAAVDSGEFVKWRDVDNDWVYGQIIELEHSGEQVMATIRRFTESGDKLDEMDERPASTLNKWDGMTDERTDSETDVSDDDSEETDTSSDDEPDGATVNQLINVLHGVVEAASTTKDAPTEDSEPSHTPMDEMANLFNKFLDDGGSPESTLSDFIEWLNDAEELEDNYRGEGEDYKLDSKEAIERMREHDAAYIPEEEDLSATDEGKTMSDSMSDEAELQDYDWHEVSWDGTTESDWSSPDLEDFPQMDGNSSWDDLSSDDKKSIGQHFIISSSGFPADAYADMKLPVVEPNGDLNVNALAAVKGGRGVSAVEGLSSEMEEKIVDYVNNLANEHFDKNWGKDEEENAGTMVPSTHQFDSKEEAMRFAHRMGLDGVHTVEVMGVEKWVPGETHEEYLDVIAAASKHMEDEEEMAKHHHKKAAEMIPKFVQKEGNSRETFISAFLEWADDDAVRKAVDEFIENVDDASVESSVGDLEDWLDQKLPSKDDEAQAQEYVTEDTLGEPTSPTKTVGGVRVLPGDDLQEGSTGASETDSLIDYNTTMNDELEEKLSELDDPVALEAEELEQLKDKADRFEELSENLEALRERTEVLDEVDREKVEELRDGDEPVVIESARYEELQSEADEVKGVYAAQLSEHYEAFDAEELAEKFSIEELRDKFEDQFGSVEELADSTEAEPQSQDPSEEELEEESGDDSSEEELSDEVQEKQSEIKDKIFGGD